MEKTNSKNNTTMIIIIAVVAILMVVGGLLLLGKNKDSKNETEDNKNKGEEKINFTEEDIIASYGMNKNDAINLVKELFNSDNFEFDALVNERAKYTVNVTNTISGVIYQYEVDPITKSFYELD